MLHPIDINDSEDADSHLGKRRDLFNAVENSITKLGETLVEVLCLAISQILPHLLLVLLALFMSTTLVIF